MKRTPWFDALKYKPVRPGNYEFYDSVVESVWSNVYWNGKRWPWQHNGDESLYKGDKWRGLTKETK